MTIVDEKQGLRRVALGRRDALSAEFRAHASLAIADRMRRVADLFRPGAISVFWPVRSEVDTRPLIKMLAEHDFALCLPVVTGDHIRFHAWRPGDPLRKAAFGLHEPLTISPQVEPANLLVPLCAFDRRGNRLGYGKGYYDRVIGALSTDRRILTIGLAFAIQEVDDVPVESHDRALGYILTESGMIACHAAVPCPPIEM